MMHGRCDDVGVAVKIGDRVITGAVGHARPARRGPHTNDGGRVGGRHGVRARPRELGHRDLDRDRVYVLAGERVEVVDVGWRDGEQVEHVQVHEEWVVALAGKYPGTVGQLPDGLGGQGAVVGCRPDADIDRRRR